MAAISAGSTTEILKAGITDANGAVIYPGFALTDKVIGELGITSIDELGEWYPTDFTTFLASLRGQKVKVPVIPFNKLELASEMIRTWKLCKIPLQIDFFTPARMEVWKKHSRLRLRVKDKRREVKEESLPRMDKKLSLVEWIHRFEHYTRTVVGLNDCGLYWVIWDKVVPIDPANGKPVPALVRDKCHVKGCTSIGEMKMKYSDHDNPVYTEDNATLMEKLDKALKGSTYFDLISKFREKRDGCGA